MEDLKWIEKAGEFFLTDENSYGCAETCFMVLKEAYGLPQPNDSSPAIALNGGVAYSGAICGALSGAAMAVGMLVEQHIHDHKLAKLTARRIVAGVIDQFQTEFGHIDCRELTGFDLRDEVQHRQFIESNLWRDSCMRQIELVLLALLALRDVDTWEQAHSA